MKLLVERLAELQKKHSAAVDRELRRTHTEVENRYDAVVKKGFQRRGR